MPSIQENQAAIVDAFSQLTDWDARYKLLIDWGKALPSMSDADKTDKNIVRGCQSQVWMVASMTEDNTVKLVADSDALIVRGLIAMILKVYNEQPPAEILANPPKFFDDIDLGKHLSMQRSNGLAAMMKQIQLYAMAFQAKAQLAEK